MNVETLEKEKFESIKKLADLTVAISGARESFSNLEKTEAEYLARREKKAQQQITKILEESAELLNKTHNNYEEINAFCNTVLGYKDFLDQNYSLFKKMLTEFEERSDLWDKRHEEQIHELSRQEAIIKQDAEKIKEGKKELAKQEEQMKKDKTLLEDRRQTLERAIARLNEGRK